MGLYDTGGWGVISERRRVPCSPAAGPGDCGGGVSGQRAACKVEGHGYKD